MSTDTQVYLAIIQHGDDPVDQETEMVTVTIGPAGNPVIEYGDVRIETIERVDTRAAA